MKTMLIPLMGDPIQNLYQLGLKEREAFLRIEKRIQKLISANLILRHGTDIVTRARQLLRKKDDQLFDQCIASYAEGLGIEPMRYYSFLSLFELAAHYGQVYPELLGLLPGCTSVFMKDHGEFSHTRLMDLPLIGLFEEAPRLYFWQREGKEPLLTYSCEGLAPLFFQGIHGSGVSFAIHHKPGNQFQHEGQGIFQIALETFFEARTFTDLKKELKRKSSMTKWSVVMLEKSGQVFAVDIEGPSQSTESYNLSESSPVVFTNIPLQNDCRGFDNYLTFSRSRETWIKGKLKEKSSKHILDRLTDVGDQTQKGWTHPAATLATVGAWSVNLSRGKVQLKEGSAALTNTDTLLELNLGSQEGLRELKPQEKPEAFDRAWKLASRAQASYDQGDYAEAYHELQMAQALMPMELWKDLMSFYLYLWDFKFISNNKELALVYKKVKALSLPNSLRNLQVMFIMRLEKKLELSPTVSLHDVPPQLQDYFQQEKLATKPLFATWMKLIYPRMEILDVFSPHHKP